MPLYTYQPASAVAEIELCESESGGFRAYLTASANATPEQLLAIKEAMSKRHDWVCLSHYRKGKPVLEVRGFETPQELENALRAVKGIEGPARVKMLPSDKRSLWQRMTSSTLKGAGFAYVVGDSAFMTYAGMEQAGHFAEKRAAEALAKKVDGINPNTPNTPNVLENLKAEYHIIDKYVPADFTLKEALPELKKLPAKAAESVQGGWFKILSGVGYAIGSFILASYGSRDQAQAEIKNAVQKIDRYILKEQLVPQGTETILTQESGQKKTGWTARIDGVLKRYPSEALNIVYTGVGLALMRSSFKQIRGMSAQIKELEKIINPTKHQLETLKSQKEHRWTERIDIGLGAVTAGSALAGLLITERKPVEGEKEPATWLGKAWRKVQAQPLIATGYGYMIATGFHAAATAKKWQPDALQKAAIDKKATGVSLTPAETKHIEDLNWNRKVVAGRGVFVGLNVVAELLMAFSSKGHGVGVKSDISIDDSVISATAEFIANQPKAQQELLIQRVSGYMASPDILDEKTDVIASKLREQIANYAYNPWSEAVTNPVIAAQQSSALMGPGTKVLASRLARAERMVASHPSLETSASPAI